MNSVMLVDDAAFLRMQLRHILEHLKYNVVIEAGNGQEAIRYNEIYKPDIIFMDITMPIMDGLEASEHILKQNPEANIIMCSALGHKELVVKTHKIGVRDFIVKPFQLERVQQALQKLEQATDEASNQEFA